MNYSNTTKNATSMIASLSLLTLSFFLIDKGNIALALAVLIMSAYFIFSSIESLTKSINIKERLYIYLIQREQGEVIVTSSFISELRKLAKKEECLNAFNTLLADLSEPYKIAKVTHAYYLARNTTTNLKT